MQSRLALEFVSGFEICFSLRFKWVVSKNIFLVVFLYLGQMDSAAIPLRPFNEPGMESIITRRFVQHHPYRDPDRTITWNNKFSFSFSEF